MKNNDLDERYPFNVINCIFGTHNWFPKDVEAAEELIGNQDFWTDYEKVLDSLDDEYEDLAVKHFKEGKTLNEIAVEEKASPEIIEARLAKTLRQLRHPNRSKYLRKYINRGIHMITFEIGVLTQSKKDKIAKGIEKYKEIKRLYDNGIRLDDTSNDDTVEFQKLFNSFYKVRRNKEWRRVFYGLLEELKTNKDVKFADLYAEFTARLKACNMEKKEKSFVSKMLHTINNDSCIIDKNVLKGLGIKGNDPVKIYDKLKDIYNGILLPEADKSGFYADFDEQFPSGTDISKVKKIDFYLWALFAK